MDACTMAHNCPLGPGTNQTFQFKLDLSSFAAIINLLASDKPYQINIPMYDFNSNSNHEQILCAVAQVMFEEIN
uniref:Uncharacterized protein n=1 Tax=Acrobeloides nanus TaxID=290746 RepID=A0A914DB94_9BILA